jgi:hypothetical protein
MGVHTFNERQTMNMKPNAGRATWLAIAVVSCALIGCEGIVIDRNGGPAEAPAPAPTARSRGKGPPAHAPAHGYRAKYEYRYWHDKGVYYATDRDQYFWLEAGEWRVGAKLPDHIVIDPDGGVVVSMDTPTPY